MEAIEEIAAVNGIEALFIDRADLTISYAADTPDDPIVLWGVATAGHQIEGNNVGSDYWLLENFPVTDYAARSGDACDSWNRWRGAWAVRAL